jgi:hypothetical protein
VYVGSDNGRVYAVNGSSGAQVWAFATGYRVYSAPAVDPVGNVYVHTEWELCVAGAGGEGGKGLTTRTMFVGDCRPPRLRGDETPDAVLKAPHHPDVGQSASGTACVNVFFLCTCGCCM